MIVWGVIVSTSSVVIRSRHALHAVEADAERLLDQLAHGSEAPVAEVLVLVELAPDRLARENDRVRGEVLGLLGDAQLLREGDEPLDEREDVLRRQDADVVRHVDLEPLVQLVAADLGQVVALGVEEPAQQVARVLERRGLAGPLLLEDLDDRLLLARGRVLLQRVRDEGELSKSSRIFSFVLSYRGRSRSRVLERGAQERGDRELALPVDARRRRPSCRSRARARAAARHQVGDEDLLRRVLRLHQVGAGGADELRHDDALGPVDDEGPWSVIIGKSPMKTVCSRISPVSLFTNWTEIERDLVGQVLSAAFLDRHGRLAELVVAELHGQRARVVLDRRDVGDRLPQALLQEPVERGLLDVDQVR